MVRIREQSVLIVLQRNGLNKRTKVSNNDSPIACEKGTKISNNVSP